MPVMSSRLGILFAAGLLLSSVCDAKADEVSLPLTIERVWFKASKKLVSSGGDLTISQEGLELVTQKKTLLIPLEDLYVLSWGRFKSDVDTDWAVLGIGASGPADLLAIRDGKKLGYGQRTRQIYESLQSALKQLGAAQYDVPPGFEAYDVFSQQFSMAVPQGWDQHVESLVVQGDGHSWGTTIFSSEEIEHPKPDSTGIRLQDDPNLQRVLSGEVPAFFVGRSTAESGMSCTGFTDKAKRKLLEREENRAADLLGYPMVEPFTLTPATAGLCSGLRARGVSLRPDGDRVRIDIYLVANEETLYVAGVRLLDKHYEATRELFETAVSTIRFSVGR
jgi:hypothetical protein